MLVHFQKLCKTLHWNYGSTTWIFLCTDKENGLDGLGARISQKISCYLELPMRVSRNTNTREERVRISRDIHGSRGRSSKSIEEALLRNWLLRRALWSDFGPGRRGRRSRVSVRSGNTNPREEKTGISVLQGRTTHRIQCIHIFWFKVARYFLADSCFKNLFKSCNSSVQRKIQGVSCRSFA